MLFYWRTLAACALAASAVFAQATQFADDKREADGIQLTSLEIYHNDDILYGVGLYFVNGASHFHGYRTGKRETKNVDVGEYISEFSALSNPNGSINYIYLGTTGKKSISFGNAKPNPQVGPNGQQLVGFIGAQNTEYINELSPLWGHHPK